MISISNANAPQMRKVIGPGSRIVPICVAPFRGFYPEP